MNKRDEHFMKILARKCVQRNDPYLSFLVYRDDDLITNPSWIETSTLPKPFAHSEMKSLADSFHNNKNNVYANDLHAATLYSSCQPCLMCLGTILTSGIGRLVYGATINDSSRYIIKEVEYDIDSVVAAVNTKLVIVKEVERKKFVAVMKAVQQVRKL